jgi:hypothetical protein
LQNKGFQGSFAEGFLARSKPLTAGLYARVSTHDQQTLPMQLAAMRDYAERRRWSVAVEGARYRLRLETAG